jgi:hypothetical protein
MSRRVLLQRGGGGSEARTWRSERTYVLAEKCAAQNRGDLSG